MKITLILAVVACACAVHALPSGAEEPGADTKQVKIDTAIASLKADLQAKFSDPAFLREKFGNPNTEFSAVADKGEHVNVGGSGSWLKYVPWGTIIDVLVDAVKKTFE